MKISNSLHETLFNLQTECPCIRLFLRGYQDSQERTSKLLNADLIGDFFSFRESEGMISYMPTGRAQQFSDSGHWIRKGRQEIKPAKWLRAMLNPRLLRRLKESDFALFSEKFKAAEQSGKITFEYVPFNLGYNQNCFYENANAINSCMWGQPVGEFYSHFPAQLLVAKDANGKFHGRAIVWVLTTGETFMDRVYSDAPEIAEMFFSYAADNRMIRKSRQSTGCAHGVIMPDGTANSKSMAVEILPGRTLACDFFPYCDTFQGLNEDENELCNNDEGNAYLLNCTDGDRETVNEHEGEVEDVDGNWISEDEAVCVGDAWYADDDDRITYCDRSEEYVLTSETYQVETARGTSITIHERFVTQNS